MEAKRIAQEKARLDEYAVEVWLENRLEQSTTIVTPDFKNPMIIRFIATEIPLCLCANHKRDLSPWGIPEMQPCEEKEVNDVMQEYIARLQALSGYKSHFDWNSK